MPIGQQRAASGVEAGNPSGSNPANARRYPSRLRRIVDQERPAWAPSRTSSSKSGVWSRGRHAPLLVVVGDVERIALGSPGTTHLPMTEGAALAGGPFGSSQTIGLRGRRERATSRRRDRGSLRRGCACLRCRGCPAWSDRRPPPAAGRTRPAASCRRSCRCRSCTTSCRHRSPFRRTSPSCRSRTRSASPAGRRCRGRCCSTPTRYRTRPRSSRVDPHLEDVALYRPRGSRVRVVAGVRDERVVRVARVDCDPRREPGRPVVGAGRAVGHVEPVVRHVSRIRRVAVERDEDTPADGSPPTSCSRRRPERSGRDSSTNRCRHPCRGRSRCCTAGRPSSPSHRSRR